MNEQNTILCIGDSIVEGYPFDLEDSWVAHADQIRSRMHRELATSSVSESTAVAYDELWVNAGISGQTTAEIRNRMVRTLQKWSPSLVILSCGTNDFIFLDGEWGEVKSAWTNIEAMAEAALSTGIKVIIAAPPLTVGSMATRRWSDGTDYDAVNRKLEELRRRIRTWCEERAGEAMFWDVQMAFQQWCGEAVFEPEAGLRQIESSHPEKWFVDGLHPTRDGYRRMAEDLCKLLE